MLAIFFMCLSVVIAVSRIVFWGEAVAPTVVDWLIISSIGAYGLAHAYTLLFDQDRVANIYGWHTVTPFQTMLAFCYLGLGLMGLSAFFFKGDSRLALIFTPTLLFLGTAYLQLTNIKKCYQRSRDALCYIIANLAVPVLLVGFFVTDYMTA